ncbi:MAG: ATPase involved in chromosome partitioning [Planctomycetota bacterium]|nr:ATPase involved in chromosome partitioning [Planctomycetota bacterium]
MSDQADMLRQLVRSREGPAPPPEPPPIPTARSLVFTSGKGGVGTSNLALNLAIALGEKGQRVALVDADFGLANLDLLCGLAPGCDLGDVLAGGRPLSDAIVPGPGDIRILPGAHGTRTMADVLAEAPKRLAKELAELEAGTDFLLIDAGSGLGPSISTIASAADCLVLVTTPEPTSVADAHASLRRLNRNTVLRVVVTQAQSNAEGNDCLERIAASSRQFLGMVVSPLGFLRFDPHVPQAVRMRKPFLTAYPNAPVSRGVRRLAETLLDERCPRPPRPGFFTSLAARWALGRVAS